MNPAGFLRDTLAPLLQASGTINPLPVIGVDEGLNDWRFVEPMLHRLVGSGAVHHSIPLWYQERKLISGQTFSTSGGEAIDHPAFSPSTGIQGYSWPDEQVVALMATEFLSHDRLCILTQNKKRNRDGLRWILEKEVAPALQEPDLRRLGLLVLCHHLPSQCSVEAYCHAVEAELRHSVIEPGYHWKFVPSP